ncbi:MAG: transport system ATP-binding/permease protein, partial [Pseudomonadota bacterium]|nr:transport system ATP-binding/permease protein [Pseudomonadota bacterium]
IVSHDRTFLDNVVTQSIVFEGDGKLTEIVGGYADWLAWRQRQQRAAPESSRTPAKAQPAPAKAALKSKLSYKEARELETLPAQIQKLEAEQAQIAARLADPALYQSGSPDATALHGRSEAIDADLLEALERWEALEAKAAG